VDAWVELIRAPLPLGLTEVGRMPDEEVERLAGPRDGRKADGEGQRHRQGSNPGSVRLGGQRHPIRVPRVRDANGEVKLVSYAELHGSIGEVDEGLFRKVLPGISCRDYEEARCQWHKRANVISYLPRKEQKQWRGRLQRAYERPTYAEAK
jgi:putative transposase